MDHVAGSEDRQAHPEDMETEAGEVSEEVGAGTGEAMRGPDREEEEMLRFEATRGRLLRGAPSSGVRMRAMRGAGA